MTNIFPDYKVLPVDILIPYARNSRTHSPEQVAQIAASIREFGFTNPVLVDENGGIIAGHGRVLAAQKLSMKEVPCIELSHLNEVQKRAYVIADNKIALNAGWDVDMLKIEFMELEDAGFDLELTGFSEDELKALEDFEPEERDLDGDKYTAKIETPIYEIKGKQPEITDLYNTDKYTQLISEVEKSDAPDHIKQFLIAAAARHIVFNYENIAEFYAHQNYAVQKLMRDSALVIVDFGAAIERNYVKLTKSLMQLSAENNSDDAE
jgi:hypothetical protein